jgi:hypothetical protein
MQFFGDVMFRVRFLQIFCLRHVGNDTTEESNQAIKRIGKSSWGDRTYRETFQKYLVPGKTIAIDESAIGFKGTTYQRRIELLVAV